MKKRIKMLVALFMALTLCLAACGQTETSKESKPTSETKKETQTAASESKTETQEESKYPDYLNLDGFRPIVKEGEEITLRIGAVINPLGEGNMEDLWLVHFLEEVLNINVECVQIPYEGRTEKQNLAISSGDLPDIMFMYDTFMEASNIMKYGVNEEMLLPVSDYFSEELTPNILAHLEKNEAAVIANTAPNGKMYSVPWIGDPAPYEGRATGTYSSFIDKRYLEAAGLETAPDTLDGFMDMLRAFKKVDPKVLGVDEAWPVLTTGIAYEIQYLSHAYGWIGNMIGSSYTNPVWDVEEKKIVVPASQEKFKEWITMFNTMYTEGLLHPDYFTMNVDEGISKIVEGKGGFVATDRFNTNMGAVKDNYVCAAPLKSDHNPTGVVASGSTYLMGQVHISADTEYPELCVRLLDYVLSPEGSSYFRYGPEKDNPDTLGLIEGYVANDTKTNIVLPFAENGYANMTAYQYSKISFFYSTIAANTVLNGYAYEAAGAKYHIKSLDELDIVNNVGHYNMYQNATTVKGNTIEGPKSAFMTEEQGVTYVDLKTLLDSHISAEIAKFIVGDRPLSELDKFMSELEAIGIQEYVDLVEEVYGTWQPAE